MDAFDGCVIPDQFRTVDFFRLARSRLSPDGHIFVNVFVQNDFDYTADDIAVSVASTGLKVHVLDTQGELDRNAIIIAGDASRLDPPMLIAFPEIQHQKLVDELSNLRLRSWRKSPSVREFVSDLARKNEPS